jgi:hypothetical protein
MPVLIGSLVTVADGDHQRDGIVFDLPSPKKAVVAILDKKRGPVLQGFHPSAISERSTDGADDPQLHALIKRTPPPTGRRSAATGVGQRAGHGRASAHRTTGK